MSDILSMESYVHPFQLNFKKFAEPVWNQHFEFDQDLAVAYNQQLVVKKNSVECLNYVDQTSYSARAINKGWRTKYI